MTWWSTGESYCSLWARLGVVGGGLTILEFDNHGWGFDGYHGEPVSAEVDIPVNGNDLIYLKFRSQASSSYGAYAMMDWLINDITISADLSSLEKYSWGEIKSSF